VVTGTALAMTKRSRAAARLMTVLLLAVGSFRILALPSTDELIQAVQKRYNGAHTLTVNFVESYSIVGHSRPPESGLLTLRKQGKMRWDYTQPPGKLFISDGKSVFLYTARDNRVEKVPLKATEDMRAPLAFLLGRLDMKKEFRDFQVRGGEGGTWLEAKAKSDRVPYDSIQMLVGPDGSIRQLKVFGRDQSITGFSFSNEKLNPPAPDELFHFKIPPGAEVVNAVQFAAEEK
jgi:outer membrane lipoprotein carrier protein